MRQFSLQQEHYNQYVTETILISELYFLISGRRVVTGPGASCPCLSCRGPWTAPKGQGNRAQRLPYSIAHCHGKWKRSWGMMMKTVGQKHFPASLVPHRSHPSSLFPLYKTVVCMLAQEKIEKQKQGEKQQLNFSFASGELKKKQLLPHILEMIPCANSTVRKPWQ